MKYEEVKPILKAIMKDIDDILVQMDKIEKLSDDAPAQEDVGKPNAKPLFDVSKKEAPKEEPTIKLSDIKQVLMEKAREGFNDQVRELINSYGAEKLSAIDEKNYKELLEKAKEIGNG